MARLLVALDGSAPSLKGLHHAISFAKALSLELTLVNVQPPVLLPPSAYAETIAQIERSQREAAQSIVDAGATAARAEGLVVSTASPTGAPAETLSDLAAADDVWGVVIGAKGHSAFSRVMLGSVTDRLVHICSKPVLVVR